MSRILIIDDDRALCRSLQIQLTDAGHHVDVAHTAQAGLDQAATEAPDLVFLDLVLPDGNGLAALPKLIEQHAGCPIVMITGTEDMRATIEAMKLGAFDYLRKPLDRDDILLMIAKAQRAGDRAAPEPLTDPAAQAAPREIVGRDPRMLALLKEIGLMARGEVTVLIEGESGTGKELVARALHDAARPGQPFVGINCSAIVGTLPETELFGHERGAFTGAERRKIGKFEHAREGTVFLDEIGDLAPDLQAKLLRVLQEREFERVGGLESLPFRARVVAATNRDLDAMVAEGRFREDLYYRLTVARLVIPPLRERRADIPLIAEHLIRRIAARIHRPIARVDQSGTEMLMRYDWPGNVRELENVLTRALALAPGGMLSAKDLAFAPHAAQKEEIVSLRRAECDHIRKALVSTEWNITRAARLLEISPTTLRKKIVDYDLKN